MKLAKKLASIALMTAISGSAMATTHASEIGLNGGQAMYNQSVIVSLNRLLSNVQYNVYCAIRSDHRSGQWHNDIQVSTAPGYKARFYINGKMLDTHGQANIATRKTNDFVAANVVKSAGYIAIRNLDNMDTVMVYNCFAQPARS